MYRQEAFESRIKGFSNPVSITGSLAAHLMLIGILSVASGLIAFGWFTDYTRRAVVAGFLQPEAGSISLTATRSGQLFVEIPNGANVTQNDKIARIVGYDVDAAGRSLLDLELQGLEEAKELIAEQLELARSRIAPLATQEELALAQHGRDIRSAEALLASRQEQLNIAKDALSREETLSERGLIAPAVVQDTRQRVITAQQAVEETEAALATLQAQTEQLRIDWQMRSVELRQTTNTLERDQRALEGQIIQTKARGESGVFAPIDGTVTFSAAQNGEAVNIGAQLFQITPKDSTLQAVLLAPSSAVGFVKDGDAVQLRYAAFPYREHGVFTGVVKRIDETAQLPSAIRAPITVSEPVYRVTVEINQAPTSKAGTALRLAPGMTLEASIIIDQKPLLLWLLDPLL